MHLAPETHQLEPYTHHLAPDIWPLTSTPRVLTPDTVLLALQDRAPQLSVSEDRWGLVHGTDTWHLAPDT